MKKLMISFVALLVGSLAYGQKSINPFAAANNYKHPQVAKKAASDKEANVSLVYVKGDVQAADYKHQNKKYEQGGGIAENGGSPINYKQSKPRKVKSDAHPAQPAQQSEKQLSAK